MKEIVPEARPGVGPMSCVHGLWPERHCDENMVLRGTSTYCAACGQAMGVTTVAGLDEWTDEDWDRLQERDRGTVVEWSWASQREDRQ